MSLTYFVVRVYYNVTATLACGDNKKDASLIRVHHVPLLPRYDRVVQSHSPNTPRDGSLVTNTTELWFSGVYLDSTIVVATPKYLKISE